MNTSTTLSKGCGRYPPKKEVFTKQKTTQETLRIMDGLQNFTIVHNPTNAR